ncbi:MAG: AraC family transcriptional regulator [Bacteroidales bacterium]
MIKRKDGFCGEQSLVLPLSVLREMENQTLYRALYITDIGYYPRALHHFRKREEPISQHVFIYCVEGKGWYRVNERLHPIEANQCFVLPANTPHSYGADENDPWTIYWIHFKGDLAVSYASRLRAPVDIKPTPNSRINDRLSLFEEIYHTLEFGYSKENLLYTCSAFHHFLGSLCYLQQYRNAGEQEPNINVVEATIHFMKEHIGKKLTVSQIAQHAGYSVSHFSGIFSEQTGYSPVNYFNLLKIQHACHLIDTTDIRINQVCYKIGIEDCYYFSRLFTKIMGISPGKYRKTKKG